jgi:hypothetical protein
MIGLTMPILGDFITWLQMHEVKEALTALQSLSTVGALVFTIATLIYSIIVLRNQRKTLRVSRESLRLGSWKEMHAFLAEDAKIRVKIHDFLRRIETNDVSLAIPTLIKENHGSGYRAYLSAPLKDFRLIARHYENMGASVRLKYLPSDLLHAVIPFPQEFWDKTTELRTYLQKNWHGQERPRSDPSSFLKNFEWMQSQWKTESKRDRFKVPSKIENSPPPSRPPLPREAGAPCQRSTPPHTTRALTRRAQRRRRPYGQSH